MQGALGLAVAMVVAMSAGPGEAAPAAAARAAQPAAAPVPADAAAAAVPIGAPLREALLNGLNGPARRLSSFRGQPLVINVWASWCGPCRAEMASLERLAWHDVAQHFAVIGISTDDYPDRALAFLRRSNATISHFIDRRLEMERMLGASSIPLTVFVGADGRVLKRVYGSREWDAPEQIRLIQRTFGLPAARTAERAAPPPANR